MAEGSRDGGGTFSGGRAGLSRVGTVWGWHSPCACLGHSHPPLPLMRTSGPGELQGDTGGVSWGQKRAQLGPRGCFGVTLAAASAQAHLRVQTQLKAGFPPRKFGGRDAFPILPAQGESVTFG